MSAKGTYALLIQLESGKEITVGRLGTFFLRAGYYLYVGSALGSGGLPARLARHRRSDKRPRWHVDYLLEYGRLLEIWNAVGEERLECLWATGAGEMAEAVPVPGFGSSDCRCLAHLSYFAAKPDYREFALKVGAILRREMVR